MSTATRPRSKLSVDEMLEITSRIKTHVYGTSTIRAVNSNGELWIVFADVCRALGYKNPSHESKKVDSSEKCKLEIGLKNTLAVGVNRRGLLSFALFANKPEASDFLAWADEEIFGVKERRTL